MVGHEKPRPTKKSSSGGNAEGIQGKRHRRVVLIALGFGQKLQSIIARNAKETGKCPHLSVKLRDQEIKSRSSDKIGNQVSGVS